MTLVEVDINNEPECLKDLRANSDNTYENLQGDCKTQVQNELRIAQRNLCAYCQKSIADVITIEHYLAQNDPEERGLGLELEFSNFLGVCSGKYYLNKMTGDSISHCGDNRKNTPLTINPRNQADIDTLSFDENARIVSSNEAISNDLNNVLKLNFAELCETRNNNYRDLYTLLIEQGSQMLLSKEIIYRRALAMIDEIRPAYYAYLRFRFIQLLSTI